MHGGVPVISAIPVALEGFDVAYFASLYCITFNAALDDFVGGDVERNADVDWFVLIILLTRHSKSNLL